MSEKKEYLVSVNFQGVYTTIVTASCEDEAEDMAIEEMREEYGSDVEVDDVYAKLDASGE